MSENITTKNVNTENVNCEAFESEKCKSENINWQQAIKILGCSRSHFYNLVNAGAIPSFRSGRVKGVRVRRQDCEEYVQKW